MGPIVWSVGQDILARCAFAPNWERFRRFAHNAQLKPFNEVLPPFPGERKCYNNNIKLPFYENSTRAYADKQRKGVSGEHTACTSMGQHVEEALSAPFFLSLQTPLPASTTEAALFLMDSPNGAVIAFWDTQLNATKTLADASLPIDEQ